MVYMENGKCEFSSCYTNDTDTDIDTDTDTDTDNDNIVLRQLLE